MNEFCIGVFAKYWQPGRVKTRLAATIGDVAAADLYRRFLELTILRCEQLTDEKVDAKFLAVDPPECLPKFSELAREPWVLKPQVPANSSTQHFDLGERMRYFFDEMFAIGAERVVLIGSDTPHLDIEAITRAFDLLVSNEVVLGPAVDGGYWLIGSRRYLPELFAGVAWSSDQVLSRTTAILDTEGIQYAFTDTASDIDDWSDVIGLRDQIEQILAANKSSPQIDKKFRELQHAIDELHSQFAS